MRSQSLSLVLIGFALLSANAASAKRTRDPQVDPTEIINQSKQFLIEREPDVTAEESALYEKACTLLSTKPELARQFIENLAKGATAEKPLSPAFDLLLGNIHYLSGAPEKAEASYLRAVERFPTFLRAWKNLGTLHFGEARYEKAIPCLAKAVTLGDREPTTFGMMAHCLEKTGASVEAELAYVQALAGDPENVSWMEGLLRVYLDAQQYPRAEIMVRALIKAQPAELGHWRIYTRIMLATDRRLEAIALLEQALATGIGGDEELAELAGLYADEDLIPEAVQTYAKIKLPAQALGEARTLQLVRILIESSEWEKAQALLDEIGQKLDGPSRIAFLQVHADLLSAQKKWPAARRVLDELLALNPLNGNALVSLGRIHAAEGDVAHATLAFEAAMQTEEAAHTARLELANIELRNRHYEKSVSHLESALALEKNPEIDDILTRVRSLVPQQGGAGL